MLRARSGAASGIVVEVLVVVVVMVIVVSVEVLVRVPATYVHHCMLHRLLPPTNSCSSVAARARWTGLQ